jgi:hypothetical protein
MKSTLSGASNLPRHGVSAPKAPAFMHVTKGRRTLAPLPLRIQKLSQVGLVGGKAVPSGPELPHACRNSRRDARRPRRACAFADARQGYPRRARCHDVVELERRRRCRLLTQTELRLLVPQHNGSAVLAAQECVGSRVSQKLSSAPFHFPQTRPSLGILLPDAGGSVDFWPLCCCAILTLRHEVQQKFAIL